jgi:hypothetical protein
MRIERGLFRIWVVCSAVWIAYWLWWLAGGCRNYPIGTMCHGWLLRELDLGEYVQLAGFVIGPPVAVFAVGLGVLWAVRGFRP